jgi:hypothetical protein
VPGYYYPPPGYAAPIYAYPPPAPYAPPPPRRWKRRPIVAVAAAPAPPQARARFFALGVRGGFLALNQEIGGKALTLAGAGIEMRFRTRGRFGMEASLDVLHGSGTLNGTVERDSYPFQLSALFYIFPNSDDHHFNLYFLGGAGVVSTNMKLNDEHNQQVTQGFTEYEAHLGGGLELRLKWFALRADVRGLALFRNEDDTPASFYANVDGGPVPHRSYGVQGTLGASIWF